MPILDCHLISILHYRRLVLLPPRFPSSHLSPACFKVDFVPEFADNYAHCRHNCTQYIAIIGMNLGCSIPSRGLVAPRAGSIAAQPGVLRLNCSLPSSFAVTAFCTFFLSHRSAVCIAVCIGGFRIPPC